MQLQKSKWKRWLPIFRTLTATAVGAASLTIILMQLEFNLLEANLYDLRMSKGPQRKAHSDIVLIAVDDASAKALNEFTPLPLDQHAHMMEVLEKVGPK